MRWIGWIGVRDAGRDLCGVDHLRHAYVENKAGLTGQTVPGRRIPGHWPYPGPEELAETEPVGPDAWGRSLL